MAQREQANVPLLLTIGVVSGILIIVLAVGLQAWYLREIQQEVRAKWDGVPLQPITDMRAQQQANINGYRWTNKEKNRVAIPIDEAIKAIAQNGGKSPSAKAE